METQNNEFLLNLKRQEFKSRREDVKETFKIRCEDVKETFKIRCAEAQHDLQHQMSEAYRMTEANLRKERDEALAAICLEEDQFNIEWAAEKFRRSQTVRPWINEKGEVTGVAVYLGDIHFWIALHDLYDHPVTYHHLYNHNEEILLPNERLMRVFCLYRREINEMMVKLGGEPLEYFYWSKVNAQAIDESEIIGYKANFQGSTGKLMSYDREHYCLARMFVELP